MTRRILNYLDDVATHEAPRTRGRALSGPMVSLWRHRLGDYRVICDFRLGGRGTWLTGALIPGSGNNVEFQISNGVLG